MTMPNRTAHDWMLISAGLVILILSLLPCTVLAVIDIVRRVEDEPEPQPLQKVL